jgi:hypothetical protein
VAEQPAQVPDPLGMWREWVSQSERQWNTFLNEAMASDQYGRSVARFMDLYLGMQRNLSEVMGRYFAALNVATRTDVLNLGDRLAAIEARLHRIEANLGPRPAGGDREQGVPAPTQARPLESLTPVASRPPRTKKPATG